MHEVLTGAAWTGLGAIIGWLLLKFTSEGTSRYPDGRCYQCRKGHASPGEVCPLCHTEQP